MQQDNHKKNKENNHMKYEAPQMTRISAPVLNAMAGGSGVVPITPQ